MIENAHVAYHKHSAFTQKIMLFQNLVAPVVPFITHTFTTLCVCMLSVGTYSDGVSEVGVVCVVSVSVEQGLAEGLVDIPSVIRRTRTQLPTAISCLVSST